MNSTIRATTGVVAALVVLAAAVPCHAVTISYVGTESSNGTTNWSNPAIPKTFATGTSNEYGKDGYWQIRPTSPAAQIFEAAGASNNLGTSASPSPTLWTGSLPSFIGSISGSPGNYVNFSGYPTYVGPDGTTAYRQGALSVSIPQPATPFNTPSGNNTGYYGDTVTFTLNYAGTVRVGFAVDSVGSSQFAPNAVLRSSSSWS